MYATDVGDQIIDLIINPLIYILFAVAFLVFIWGLFQFVTNPENPSKRQDGIRHMIWGFVGLFIMISSIGIIRIIDNTLDLDLGSEGIYIPDTWGSR